MQSLLAFLSIITLWVPYKAENDDTLSQTIQIDHIHHEQLNFFAFDHHYKLLLQRNTALFSPSFYKETQTYDHMTKQTEKHRSNKIPQCYFTVHDSFDKWGNETYGVLSLCDHGIRGWIHAFDTTITIEPNPSSKNKQDHIVYKKKRNNILSTNHHHRRRTTSQQTRYVELAVVNDPGMLATYSDLTELEYSIVSMISTVDSWYANTDWGTDIGEIRIVLSAIIYIETFGELEEPTLTYNSINYNRCPSNMISDALYDSSRSDDSTYCEIDYNDYLNKFQMYRRNNLLDFDNAQLLSYYDFDSTVRGNAIIPGMCIASSSGGIIQATFGEFDALTVAQAIGSNFGMYQDGNGNYCDANDKHIMSSVMTPDSEIIPTTFSECSVSYVQNYFNTYASTAKCLDNEPTDLPFRVCGNGIIENGERCDCGQNDCSAIDPCCDGIRCGLLPDVECSNTDLCCDNCMVKAAGTVCRELDTQDTCDIEEVCDGVSAECPSDKKHIEGTQCTHTNMMGNTSVGYCYDGSCVSLGDTCLLYGRVDCGIWILEENGCDHLQCAYSTDPSNCIAIGTPDDGTPCNKSNSSLPAQCMDGLCRPSSLLYRYVWTASVWSDCSIMCKESDADDAGTQERNVECTLHDGETAMNDSYCDADVEPISVKTCNDFICYDSSLETTKVGDEASFVSVLVCSITLFLVFILLN